MKGVVIGIRRVDVVVFSSGEHTKTRTPYMLSRLIPPCTYKAYARVYAAGVVGHWYVHYESGYP